MNWNLAGWIVVTFMWTFYAVRKDLAPGWMIRLAFVIVALDALSSTLKAAR